MIPLPWWMRWSLYATAVMNILGASIMLAPSPAVHDFLGIGHERLGFYQTTLGCFVLIFGLAYGWVGKQGTADRVFIAVGASGKLVFFSLLVWYWMIGAIPARTPLLGSGDLIVGALFVLWLYRVRSFPQN